MQKFRLIVKFFTHSFSIFRSINFKNKIDFRIKIIELSVQSVSKIVIQLIIDNFICKIK